MKNAIVCLVGLFSGFVVGGGFARPWRRALDAIEAWRFRRRWPAGALVRIRGNCCEKKHRGRVVRIARQYLTDRWEVRFDPPAGSDEPYGCCAKGMERVLRGN